HSMSPCAASSTNLVAAATSGPMPSPGMSVTLCAMSRNLSGRSSAPDHGDDVRPAVDRAWLRARVDLPRQEPLPHGGVRHPSLAHLVVADRDGCRGGHGDQV